jgi:hypothetical protein
MIHLHFRKDAELAIGPGWNLSAGLATNGASVSAWVMRKIVFPGICKQIPGIGAWLMPIAAAVNLPGFF